MYPHRQPEPQWQPQQPTADDAMPAWLEERLFDRRVVMLRGSLTGPVASRVAAALLTLDAASIEPVELHVSALDGELAAAFAIVDAIDTMRAPLHAVIPGQAGGAPIAVLAAAERRVAYQHARIRFSEPRAAPAAGTADEVAAAAGQYLRELEELVVRLAEVTGQPRSRIEDDLSAGRMFTAEQAKDYGLIDEIAGATPPS
jgi:ATP-dependent Clp protease protease subunit